MSLASMTDSEILAIADPIMDNLMQASTEIDHPRHIRDFTPRLAAIVTPGHLETVCRHYQAEKGVFTDRRLVALFRRPDSVALVWRQQFSRAKGEYVAEMVLVEQQGHYLVDHVMVF